MAESALDADTQAYLTESLCGGDDDAWEETLSSFLPDEADAPVIAKLTAVMREAVPADTSQPQAPGKVQLAAPVTLSDDLLVEGTSGSAVGGAATSARGGETGGPAAAGVVEAVRFGTADYGSATHAALDELDELDDNAEKWLELQRNGCHKPTFHSRKNTTPDLTGSSPAQSSHCLAGGSGAALRTNG